jgi:hypothetical protein
MSRKKLAKRERDGRKGRRNEKGKGERIVILTVVYYREDKEDKRL